ncbi:hypothetical protein EV44_g3567 [Erysiphe necator]|uniref:GAG-pre-integrase domain-containing protein n=1 Tax=Uncinula necator TaxID=52586 RepID=A0A0B1PAJ2_UNCNE|nr:hypothetical protein EV44_g3567 [Erysiphe necator]
MVQLKLEDNDNIPETSQYMTAYGEIDGFDAISQLHDQSIHHALAAAAPIKDKTNRYNSLTFQGIMIDIGAAQWSTAGEAQVRALQKLRNITIDSLTAGKVKIIFGIGATTSLGTVSLETNIGIINFNVVPSNTPFLLSLKDMDTLKVKLDNLRNVLLQGNQEFPFVRKFGHPFLLLTDITTTIIYSCDTECHLSEPELRQLHRRFGHPSSRRLLQILKRSGHNVNSSIVKYLGKYCHLCQLHGKSLGRFKFILRDDIEFNHSIIVDVMYIEGNPVLHVIDEATRFGAAGWLKNISTQHTLDMLRNCWIDV